MVSWVGTDPQLKREPRYPRKSFLHAGDLVSTASLPPGMDEFKVIVS